MKVVAIIPAKRESQRLPGKNMKQLGWMPLVQWTIIAAHASQFVHQVVCCSDCPDILYLAERFMCSPSVSLPDRLVKPERSATDAVLYACEQLEDLEAGDLIVQLLPTSPFRAGEHIDAAIELYMQHFENDIHSVVSIIPYPMKQNSVLLDEGQEIRQAMPIVLSNGAIQIASWGDLFQAGTFHASPCVPYRMLAKDGLDIDTPADFALAQLLLEHQYA